MVKLLRKMLIQKFFLICSVAAVLSLTGCSDNQVIELAEEDSISISYEKISGMPDKVSCEEYVIYPPENGYVGTFCIYGSTVYYAVDFKDWLMNPEKEGRKEFEPHYNTQIRAFDNEQDVLIYQYDEANCVEITDMYCNGEVLIWEDYGVESDWSIKCLPLIMEESEEPECILSAQDIQGDLWTITPTLTKDKMYWYQLVEEEYILYQYDFEKKKTEKVRNGLTLYSPYEHVSILNGVCTVYEAQEAGQIKIRMDETDSQSSTSLLVDGKVRNPICNGTLCIWEAEDDVLYVYKLEEGMLEKIDIRPQRIFSYGLLGDYVIVNCRGEESGIYCYDVKNKICTLLASAENVVYLYTFQGLENNVYLEVVDEDETFKIMNIQLMGLGRSEARKTMNLCEQSIFVVSRCFL